MFLTTEQGVKLGMKGWAVIHMMDVGELVEHDQTLEIFWQEDAIEREVDGVFLAAEEAFFASYTATPAGAGAVDLDFLDGEAMLLGEGQELGREVVLGLGSQLLDL